MKPRVYGWLIVSFSVAIILISGCTSKTKNLSPPLDFVHEVSDLKPDPNIIYGQLANGLRYGVIRNIVPKSAVAIRMRIGTGSLNETDEQLGLAHFLEHMAFNGSKNIAEGDMKKTLERYGMKFGRNLNAHTGFDETVYKFNLPTVGDAILDETFFVMREVAENLTLTPDSIERERGIIQSEMRTRMTPAYKSFVAKRNFFGAGSRLPKRPVGGTVATLETMQVKQFKTYYQAFYRPESTFILVVGDIDADSIVQKIDETFASWKPTGLPGAQQGGGAVDAKLGRTGYYTHPGLLTFVTVAAINSAQKPIDTNVARRTALVQALGRGILKQRLRVLRKNPNANFFSGTVDPIDIKTTASGAELVLRASPKDWQKALAVAEQELRRAYEFGFSKAELNEQVSALTADYVLAAQARQFSYNNNPLRDDLATKILKAYATDFVFTDTTKDLENFKRYVADVSPDEVWAAFKKQWKNIDKPLVFLSTSEKITNPHIAIQEAVQASQAQVVKPWGEAKKTKPAKFAYSDFGPAGKVVSEKYIENLDAYLIKFDNNVYLNFKRGKFRNGMVDVQVKVGDGGLSIPYKDEALRRLAGNVMRNGGLEMHTKDEIHEIMGSAVEEPIFSVATETNAFKILGQVKAVLLGTQLKLMAAKITSPGYRQDTVTAYQKAIAAWYPTHDATPQGVLDREEPRLIRSGHKLYGFSNQENSFYKFGLNDVQAWLGSQLKDGMIDVTIVGDVSKKAAIKAVENTLGSLGERKVKRGVYPEMANLKFPKGNNSPVTFVHKGSADQAILRIYWPAPDGSDIVQNRRLNVLKEIFRNRVIEEIREKEAAVYTPSVGMFSKRMFQGFGYLYVSMDIDPANLQAMSDKIHEIADSFQKLNINEDEFYRAVSPILKDIRSKVENNSDWLDVLSDAQIDSWGIDNFRTREQTYRDMKLADIKLLAAEIFRKENAFHVQIIPATNIE